MWIFQIQEGPPFCYEEQTLLKKNYQNISINPIPDFVLNWDLIRFGLSE